MAMRSFIGMLFCMSLILSVSADRIDEIERSRETKAQNREANVGNRENNSELLHEMKAQYKESHLDDEINELEAEHQAAAQWKEFEGTSSLPEAKKLRAREDRARDHIVPSQMEEDINAEMKKSRK
jgi:hypothetical protein